MSMPSGKGISPLRQSRWTAPHTGHAMLRKSYFADIRGSGIFFVCENGSRGSFICSEYTRKEDTRSRLPAAASESIVERF
jgi:hypothetical protein